VIALARLVSDTRCHDVTVLDVRGLSPVTDYFVIATGGSAIQMRTVAREAAELGKSIGVAPMGASGGEEESWFLVDFVHVVLHVFNAEARSFYDLESLWGDAPKVKWENK
jgi:ribosome-associated protein